MKDKKQIVPLEDKLCMNAEIAGGKAANLCKLIDSGFRVPKGVCIIADVYTDFIKRTRAKDFISFELGRKSLKQMRWEEMWDASLRIRNFFLKADFPENMRNDILNNIGAYLKDKQLAIRSSSNFEDSEINSYAGLHESFLNVKSDKEILKHIKLVWASLWSDASIAYFRELGLDIEKSRMAVVVQEMLSGEVSGVAFGVSPVEKENTVIEAVSGLNKGLVDGDVEPDRWILERTTGKVLIYTPAKDRKKTISLENGTRIVKDDGCRGKLLHEDKVVKLYNTLRELKEKMGFIPDAEWTISDGDLYILQVRPVTLMEFQDKDIRRGWDMTLRRSFNNLKELSLRIKDELIPEMLKEADNMEEVDLGSFTDEELADEINKRKTSYEKWQNVYWDEFIPFAHGARLFGQVYNDKMHPEDPYEFVDIISSEELVSIKRNGIMEKLARKLKKQPALISENNRVIDQKFKKEIDEAIKTFPGISLGGFDAEEKETMLISFIKKAILSGSFEKNKPSKDRAGLENFFLNTFSGQEKKWAQELINLARLSYKFRDDDNIYLGRIGKEVSRALSISREKLGERCKDERSCQVAEEVIMALKMPEYMPKEEEEEGGKKGSKIYKRRQIRGQPAGKGIARGPARIIEKKTDLFDVQAGDIIVCDAIDPEMTFVIPIVSGIVEKRGGMLIHGAIIAREYGLPCVTGVDEATKNIKGGDDITVDGYFGLVINHSIV